MIDYQKAAAGFSFAPHEDDPTDVAVNPASHFAAGIAKGTAAGTAAGAALGFLSGGGGRKGLANLGTRVGRMGTAALVGAGAGGALGYHQVETKRRAVEQAYGAQDPFALQKMGADEAYAMGRLFALQKIANLDAAAAPEAAPDNRIGYAAPVGLAGAVGAAGGAAHHTVRNNLQKIETRISETPAGALLDKVRRVMGGATADEAHAALKTEQAAAHAYNTWGAKARSAAVPALGLAALAAGGTALYNHRNGPQA